MRRINYYPELVQFAGSINSALMMAQLEFWFASTKGSKFYKFLEPCEHERYKPGDSWMEELSMSKFEIRQAFRRIGVVYKSKKAFDESKDIFQGKPYASYYDRMRKTTYYLRNTQQVKKVWESAELKAMGGNNENGKSGEGCGSRVENEGSDENECCKRDEGGEENKGYERSEGRDENESFRRGEGGEENKRYERFEGREGNESCKRYKVREDNKSHERYESGEKYEIIEVNESRDRQEISKIAEFAEKRKDQIGNLHKSISVSLESEAGLYIKDNNKDIQVKTQEERLSYVPHMEICDLYNQYLGEDLGCKEQLSKVEKEKVNRLWTHLGKTLEDFKMAFFKASQSRFLCGKIPGKKWRASLIWLLDEENLRKVLEGLYDDFASSQIENGNSGNSMMSNSCSKPADSKVRAVSPKVQKFNEMPSHGWDFDEIERLERMYIDQKIMEMNDVLQDRDFVEGELA